MKAHKILIAVLAACTFGSCNQSNDVAERNKNTILKAHEELLTKRNLAYADEAFASDYTVTGFEQKGPELIKYFVTEVTRAFPDMQYTVDNLVAEGSLVSWTRTSSGVHKEDYMGYKATGKTVTWVESNLTKFSDDGKIIQEWSTSDFDVNVSKAANVEGVYTYVAPLKGQASVRNGRFVHLYGQTDGPAQLTGEAGTYKIDGAKVICTYTHSTNAKNVGTSFTWQTKSWSGDTLTYELLNDKGEVSGSARAVRVSN